MKNTIGSIVKKRESAFSTNTNNFVYKVSLLNKRVAATFDNFPDAKHFVDKHALELLDTKKVHIVSVRFKREDGRSSYFIYENSLEEYHEEFLGVKMHEQAEFDYYLTNEWSSRRDKTRKMMNVRYYSFHDVARVTCLMSVKSIILKMLLAISIIVTSVIFLAYGLHIMNNDKYIHLIADKRHLYNILISVTNSFAIFGGTCVLASFIPQWRILAKNKYNYDYIKWRGLYKKRKYATILATISFNIALTTIIAFYIGYSDSEVFKNPLSYSEAGTFRRVLFASTTLISILWLITLISIISFYWVKIHSLKSYFTTEERHRFDEWVAGREVQIPYKTDEEFYVYPFKECQSYAQIQIQAFNKLNKTTSIEEWKQAKRKSRGHLKIAVKQYFKTREV